MRKKIWCSKWSHFILYIISMFLYRGYLKKKKKPVLRIPNTLLDSFLHTGVFLVKLCMFLIVGVCWCVWCQVYTLLSGEAYYLDPVLSAGDHLPSSWPSHSYRRSLHYSYFGTDTLCPAHSHQHRCNHNHRCFILHCHCPVAWTHSAPTGNQHNGSRKSSNISHLSSNARLLSPSHSKPSSISTVLLQRLAFFLFSSFFSFLSLFLQSSRVSTKKGRELILQHCQLGLVLSYGSTHRGRRIRRQILYVPVPLSADTEQLLL